MAKGNIMNKLDYYTKGMRDARIKRIVAFGECNSWQKKAYKRGYQSGLVYLQGEALLNGFEDKWEYQAHVIKQAIS